jgi:hypothetical protein
MNGDTAKIIRNENGAWESYFTGTVAEAIAEAQHMGQNQFVVPKEDFVPPKASMAPLRIYNEKGMLSCVPGNYYTDMFTDRVCLGIAQALHEAYACELTSRLVRLLKYNGRSKWDAIDAFTSECEVDAWETDAILRNASYFAAKSFKAGIWATQEAINAVHKAIEACPEGFQKEIARSTFLSALDPL